MHRGKHQGGPFPRSISCTCLSSALLSPLLPTDKPLSTAGPSHCRYNRLDDLILVIFVATGGGQANYSAGNTTSTPFFFRRITMNFAGSVVLALRPTVCTSLGPS